MIAWTDEAIVLASRAHGETAAVATLLTRDHGLHAGLVHCCRVFCGGAARRTGRTSRTASP